jgi:hypothetical protein
MATEVDHIALANKNQDALGYMIGEVARFPEWVTTIAFYKGVQLVEAVFANNGKHTHGHKDRHEMLKAPTFQVLYRDYRALWSASTVARYLYDNDRQVRYSQFSDYLPPDRVIEKLVNKRLRTLEQHAISMLSPRCCTSLKRLPST